VYGAITGVSITKPVLVRETSKRKGRARHLKFFICFSNEANVQGQLGKRPLLITLILEKVLLEKI
jgi:hypothetical protein